MPGSDRDALARAGDELRRARHVAALTGAGVSAASGLATYRAPGGMWSDEGLLAAHHVSALPGSLPVIWETKGPLRAAALAARPNDAHRSLARFAHVKAATGGSVVVVTQNIDGLHQKAGSPSVLELHGSVLRTRCSKRGCSCPPFDDASVPGRGEIPRCPQCGRPARPAIVLFGEAVPARVLRAARRAVLSCEALVVIGTSGAVHPAADLLDVAARRRVPIVLVNAEAWSPPHPGVTHTVLGRAEELLPELLR